MLLYMLSEAPFNPFGEPLRFAAKAAPAALRCFSEEGIAIPPRFVAKAAPSYLPFFYVWISINMPIMNNHIFLI